MSWLIRKTAALVAAYAIALQALLSSFAPAAHLGLDTFAVICTADASGEHQPALPRHGSACDACLAACSAAPALLPASAAFSFVVFTDKPERPLPAVEMPSVLPRHQPQASRAPPLFS